MRKSIQLIVVLVGFIVAGCAATSFESTWKEPGAGPGEIKGTKLVAIALAPDSARRPAEETIVMKLAEYGAEGMPSYRIVDTDAPKDEMVAKLKREGIEAAIVVKLLKEDKEVRSTNTGVGVGMYAPYRYGGFYGGGWGWGMYSAPEIRTDTLVYLETLVYSVDDEKLIWAGRSKTTNPSNMDKFIGEVVDAAIKEMIKDGLLVKN